MLTTATLYNAAPTSASPTGVRVCSILAPSRTLAMSPLLRSTVRWCDAVDTARPQSAATCDVVRGSWAVRRTSGWR